MKLFVTGVNGQLGYDIVKEARKQNYQIIGSDITQTYSGICDFDFREGEYVSLDITSADNVREVLYNIRPDVVIHCAAWTAVDAAEDNENIEKVFSVNEKGTKNIAEICKEIDCKLVYISTDYVFDGSGEEPRKPDCNEYAPINVYGKSKLGGEIAVAETMEKFFVVRISWVFGENGNNFVKTMLNVGKKYETVRVVNDQIGSPTYTYDLAKLLLEMSNSEKYGFYHATNSGEFISWYDFCCEIFRLAGYKTNVIPVTTEEYGVSKAKRPFNSRLDKNKLSENGFMELPHWKESLQHYLLQINNNDK